MVLENLDLVCLFYLVLDSELGWLAPVTVGKRVSEMAFRVYRRNTSVQGLKTYCCLLNWRI